MAEKVITRQMWCERCFKANRPYRDNQLVVCGENGFHVRTVERYVPPEDKGFTPHLLELYKVLDDKNVAIVRVCCVVGCGLNIADDPQDRNKSIFTYSKVSYDQITLADYNAIVMCKNFGYYL
jgi:hypothetical protein